MLALEYGSPAKSRQPVQQNANARCAVIRETRQVRETVRKLLVFCADTPLVDGLTATFEILDQLRLAGNRFAVGLRGCGHGLGLPLSFSVAKLCEVPFQRTLLPITKCRPPTGHRRKHGSFRSQDAGSETHFKLIKGVSNASSSSLVKPPSGPHRIAQRCIAASGARKTSSSIGAAPRSAQTASVLSSGKRIEHFHQ